MNPTLAMDALADAVARLPADRLSSTRAAALHQLRGRGLPSTRDEDWKYLNLKPVVEISNRWLEEGAAAVTADNVPAQAAAIRERIDAHWFTMADGQLLEADLQAAREAGIDVSRLSESERPLPFTAPLADLNAALLRDGLLIRIDASYADAKPIGLLIIDDASSGTGVTQARIEVDAAAGTSAGLIEYHVSAGALPHYANSVVNLRLADDAHLDYVRIQARAAHHCQTGRLTAKLGRRSRFTHAAFDFGGQLIRNDLQIDIDAPEAHAEFTGLYLADDTQLIDNHTRVDHRVGPASSTQEYRGILAGAARCVWNGKAIVHAGADGTDARQANHNLLLSDKAEIDAKPELEIYADDVKCSHGTTIGQLDDSALYYLQTRGLDDREARRLLTRAFAQVVVGQAPIAAVQETIAAMVVAKLDQLTQGDRA